MSRIRVSAPAKVNLYLELLGQRPDGFHDLETVFQAVDLQDVVELDAAVVPGIQYAGDTALGPIADNLCVRAATAWFRRAGIVPRLRITLRKRIPHGAGLGGGSSDAAAVLMGLQRLFPRQMNDDDLAAIALSLGSDVPFFLIGGRCHALGQGELLTPLRTPAYLAMTLFIPEQPQSTPAAFAALSDRDRGPRQPRGPQAFADDDLWGHNRFVATVRGLNPAVARCLDALTHLPAALSGSGCACWAWGHHEAPSADVRALTVRTLGPDARRA